jgi:hypothetical protein
MSEPKPCLKVLPERKPDEDLVEAVRELLERVESGEVLTLAFVYETKRKFCERVFVYSNDDQVKMLGMLENAKAGVVARFRR